MITFDSAIAFLKKYQFLASSYERSFEFPVNEIEYACQVLEFIKVTLNNPKNLQNMKIKTPLFSKGNASFKISHFQYDMFMSLKTLDKTLPRFPAQPQPQPQENVDPYVSQMEFINFYISNKKHLRTVDEIDLFFSENPRFNHYKPRVSLINLQLSSQRVHFSETFLKVPVEHIQDHLKMGYHPFEEMPDKEATYNSEEIALAPAADQAIYRHFTRYRLVYGSVPFYLEPKDHHEMRVLDIISACAPNLMGTSKNDSRTFIRRNGTLNTEAYQTACSEIADLIVSTAKSYNKEKLIMPAFGVGVYIKKLRSLAQKKLAIDIMYTAFAKAADYYQLHIDWVMWDKEKNPLLQQNHLSQLKGDNSFIHNIPHHDILAYASEEVERNVSCVVLNAGSDRTIGGKYTAKNPTTIEEQIAHRSDLLFLQTVYNPQLIERFEHEFQQRVNPAAQQDEPKQLSQAELMRMHGMHQQAPAAVTQPDYLNDIYKWVQRQ